jgi:hypothetical protein
MYRRVFVSVVSMALALLVPVQLLGQESASAMVYANGSATVNGTEIPKSVAVFPGDQLETKPDASATLGTNGSSVMLLSNSVLKYEGSSVAVDRGSVRVITASSFEAHACDVWARPVSNTATQYEFIHNDGHVTVAATKGDVFLEERHGSRTDYPAQTGQESKPDQALKIVKEGEQATREDGCELVAKPKRRPASAIGIGNPPVLYTTIGVTGGVITWLLLHGGHDHNHISPSCPNNTCL